MRFQGMVDATIEDQELLAAIAKLLFIKRRAKESELSVPIPVINRFIESQLERLDSVRTSSTGDMDFSVLDRLLLETVMNKPA